MFGLDIVDFYRGLHSWGRFDNLISKAERRPGWVSAARATDVEVYRAARDAGKIARRKPATDPIEWGTTNQQLSALLDLTQQLIHAVYVHQTDKARTKARVNHWPAPLSAEQMVKAAESREVFDHLEQNVIRAVPADEYARLIAEAAADAAETAPTEPAAPTSNVSLEELQKRLAATDDPAEEATR